MNLTHMLKIGILGGGQLARMLALSGHNMGLEMHILSANPDDPAAQVTRHWYQGDVSDQATLDQFFKSVDIVLIESEFLDEHKLLAAEANSGISVIPSARLIGELQDRLKQKTFLEILKIPSAPFSGISSAVDAEKFFSLHKKGIVLKKRRFGYDGYGTFLIPNEKAFKNWALEHSSTASDFIVEKKISFRRELAMTIVRTASGQFIHFPLVEWKAKDAKCHWVKGPVRHPQTKKLTKLIESGLKKAGYVGVITFELFDTGKELIVNEIAPRVHNSAHYSIDAMSFSQFDLHLLAAITSVHEVVYLDKTHLKKVKRAKLGDPKLYTKGFAMVNLIGNSTDHPMLPTHSLEGAAGFDARLHWYGKSENRPGRKMGHITVLDTSPEKALKKALRFEKMFKL